jgi:hypothetical protein
MNNLLAPVWFAVGLLAGWLHAILLWQSVRRPSAWLPGWSGLRSIIVGGALVAAALAGGMLSASAGWAIGLSFAAGLLLVQKDKS